MQLACGGLHPPFAAVWLSVSAVHCQVTGARPSAELTAARLSYLAATSSSSGALAPDADVLDEAQLRVRHSQRQHEAHQPPAMIGQRGWAACVHPCLGAHCSPQLLEIDFDEGTQHK